MSLIKVSGWFLVMEDARERFRSGIYKDYGLKRNIPAIDNKRAHLAFEDGTIEMEGKTIRVVKVGKCEDPQLQVSDEERRKWRYWENTYIANELLKECGWGVFQHFVSMNPEGLYDFHVPCEGADGQCHMDCPFINKCDEMLDMLSEIGN